MKLNNPNYLNGLVSNAGEIDEAVSFRGHPQLSKLTYELKRGVHNLKILSLSDSTGNDVGEWNYHFAKWLSEKYPKYKVYWHEWNTITRTEYKTPHEFGAGIKRLDIFSYGIGGTRCDAVFENYTNGVLKIMDNTLYPSTAESINLITVNHGQNYYDEPVYALESRFAEVVETLLLSFPDAGVIIFHQNPRKSDDSLRLLPLTASLNYATRRGFAIADVNKLFYKYNKMDSLYYDDLHPTSGLGTEVEPSGTRLFLQAITELFTDADRLIPSLNKSTLATPVNSMITNSGFSVWTNTSSHPDYFTTNGLISSKDTLVYEDRRKAYSWKLVTNGSGQAVINMSSILCNANSLKGQWVTLAVRLRYDSGIGNSPLRIRVGGSETTPISYPVTAKSGDWFWKCASHYVQHNEDLSCFIYVDAGTSNGFTVNIDRICLAKGKDIRDIL